MLNKTEHRLALIILVTSVLPLASAMLLAYSLLNYASSVWLRPEVEAELDRGIDLYGDYIRVVKDDMKHQTDAMAADPALRDAARRSDKLACERALEALFPRFARLVSLAVEDGGGQLFASTDRGRPLDEASERKLEVRRELVTLDGAPASVVATFAFDRRYEQDLGRAGAIYDAYSKLTKDRADVYAGYFEAFALLLGITAFATVMLGFVLARGMTRRIRRLAVAIDEVAAGNLEVRVPVTGSDELTELARVFNRMLGDMQQSRARIEYLQRIGAWQEMAQRLAHEIKNPLTPIQLAVQECHRKYSDGDPRYRSLLDTTLEIVEEEVGTLRRLVGNFSSFARLPHAELREADLRELLRECADQLVHLGADLAEDSLDDGVIAQDVDLRWEVPDEPVPVEIDRQMLRRVLVNLVRNAVEAIRGARPARQDGSPRGRVVVHAEHGTNEVVIRVEDDGPGVPEAVRGRVFDPYFTTKADGTGLGLAIVKKIVVEHNGTIAAGQSERLGGASFALSLPPAHSLAIAVARETPRDAAGAFRPSPRRPAA
jgi:nitrogen fixation/metabolism regulation signal transduction histidine kinase